jgi:hypothetical protein
MNGQILWIQLFSSVIEIVLVNFLLSIPHYSLHKEILTGSPMDGQGIIYTTSRAFALGD